MKQRKPQLRTCIGCGREAEKRDLLRIVRSPEGNVLVDPTGKKSGRGAYVCANEACFEAAIRKNRLGTALRATIAHDDVDRLRQEFERAASKDARSGSGR